MQIPGTYPLQPVDSGRLFFRPLSNGMVAFAGVVELPADTPVEHVMAARLNDKLWLDVDHAERLGKRASWPQESDVGGLLLDVKWRAGGLPDAFETGVRGCHLQHDDPARRWVIVFGGLKQPLRAAPAGGLYELTGAGLVHVDANPYVGEPMNQVLREPIWGPGGKFGLATSMDPTIYESWVVKDRERNASRDPQFAKFIERSRKELGEPPLVYTREEKEARDKAALPIITAIMGEEEAEFEARYAAKSQSKSSFTP